MSTRPEWIGLPEVDDGAVALVVIDPARLFALRHATAPSRSFISDLLDNGADLAMV